MSSIPIDKQYHGFGDILLLDVLHEITQDFKIDVTIHITFGGDGTAPPARDTCVRNLTNVLVPVPRPSVHQADTNILAIGGDCDRGGDVLPTVSACVVHRPIPPLLSQDTLVLHARTERSLVLVIIILLYFKFTVI